MIDAPPDAFAAFLAGLPPPGPNTTPIKEIQETHELQRIRDAARHDWASTPDLESLRLALTRHLQMPGGEQSLRPIQAAALREVFERGSVVIPLRTGGGKTLIAFLAPEITKAKRPLLVVPAKMINSGKTERDHIMYRKHWRLRPMLPKSVSKARALHGVGEYAPLRVVSYEALGRVDYADALQNWNPDLVMFDEVHKCKDPRSAVTRRLSRFIRTAKPAVLEMTGSLSNRRLGEYAHLLRWALHDAAPLPNDFHELTAWGFALDEKVNEYSRIAPGALMLLSPYEIADEKGKNGEPRSQIEIARRRYARRLRSTPAIIASGDDLPGMALTARVETKEPDANMIAVVKHLRDHWETPCGHPFEMATALWAHEREVSAGFYYRWDVQPAPEWLSGRRAWSNFVREVLKRSRTYDSPLAVANAVDAGKIDDFGTLEEWRRVAPLFKPDEHQEPVWISEQTVDFCAEWLRAEQGICWVYHTALGRRLSEKSGVPYFSSGGKCGKVSIDQYKGPAIASIRAVNEGFNLQELHSRNLIATCPTTNLELEQLISRTHRDGQPEDEVTLLFLQTLEGDRKALDQARADAVYVESTLLQPQRLAAATWIDE